jgi:D-alanyl-D-alanine carboxypeptidase/D-alanyl-D-alanine-endopeptidase (penicillin-binding protein 4)
MKNQHPPHKKSGMTAMRIVSALALSVVLSSASSHSSEARGHGHGYAAAQTGHHNLGRVTHAAVTASKEPVLPSVIPTTAPVPSPSPAWEKLLVHSGSYQEGILIQHEDGTESVSVNAADSGFNPASNTKLATSLAVLRKFGPDYTFSSEVRYTGAIDAQGELHGDLYIEGNDMLFGDRQAHELVQILTAHKIKSITGDLYVSSSFSMNLDTTGATAGAQLLNELDPFYKKRHQGVNLRKRQSQVVVGGSVKVGPAPSNSTVLAAHVSPPLKDMLKIMLCYSDNTMAKMFGDMIGGPDALTQFVRHDLGVPASEATFASTSGLDVNRVSPRAMQTILKALRAEVAAHGLKLSDILAVAGVDPSTLEKRFTGPYAGSVVGKTGTLTETDHGASALSGEIHTKKGTFLFTIFEIHGNFRSFRVRQNELVQQFERDYGGPAPIAYKSFVGRIDHEDKWK